MHRVLTMLALSGVLVVPRAAAQVVNPGPPGPWVADVRAATSGVPSDAAFYTGLPSGASVPARGFGGALGGHLYLLRIGPTRLGVGADAMFARGSTRDAVSTVATLAPQLSFNFGSSNGWSYLSAGVGPARIRLEPGAAATVRSVNIGGGARWFLGRNWGVGFDVRFHRLAEGRGAGSQTPRTTIVSVSVGVSVK